VKPPPSWAEPWPHHVDGPVSEGQHDHARETLAAAILSYDWSEPKVDTHDAWIAHILRRQAESMFRLDAPTMPEK
jgi:hypothetical protein